MPAGEEHGEEDRRHGDQGVEEVGDRLGHHLPEGVGIVGVKAHHIPVRSGIEVLDRQALHMGEHIISDRPQRPLADRHHQDVVGEGGEDSTEVD